MKPIGCLIRRRNELIQSSRGQYDADGRHDQTSRFSLERGAKPALALGFALVVAAWGGAATASADSCETIPLSSSCPGPPSPRVLSAPSIQEPPGATIDSSPLTASAATFSYPVGRYTTSHSYAWLRCDAAGADCVAIAGATSSSYSVQSDDVGGTLRFADTAKNTSTDTYVPPCTSGTAQAAASAAGSCRKTSSTTATSAPTRIIDFAAEASAVQQAAIDYFTTQYQVSRAVAGLWLEAQARANGLETEIRDSAAGPGLAGVWFDNVNRRLKVALKTGTAPGVIQDIVDARNLTAATDVTYATYSQDQIEAAKPSFESAIADLVSAGLVEFGRDPETNSVLASVGTAATAAQRGRVDAAAAASPVRVLVRTASTPTPRHRGRGR